LAGPLAPWMAPSSPHGWVYGVSCQPTPPHPRQISGDGGRSTPCVDESPLKSNTSTIERRASTHGVDPRVGQGRHPPTAAEICQRRGGVGVRGVSRMDAAAKPTWTYLRRPRTPTPPRHNTEIALWLLLLPLLECFGGCRAQPCRYPTYLAAAICFSMSAAVTGPRKLCASLPCGSMRCVNGRPRGVAKSAGGSNGSTITIG
jgi:hypothetical protein